MFCRFMLLIAVALPLGAAGADLSPVANGLSPAQAVFERYLEITGGRPALESIHSVLAKGTVKEGEQRKAFELRAKRNGAFLLVLKASDGTTVHLRRVNPRIRAYKNKSQPTPAGRPGISCRFEI
ncbi:MAG: hypothetical protein HZA31_10585 [Opitutae bacterium]|nr:hypothetical protein [Opitutae bacterium]